jgi:pimeloyl-ACP methyl ester carboxylesterase
MSDTEDVLALVQEFFKITKLPHDPFTKAFLNRCQSHTIKANGKFYKYFQSGSGPIVLHVHGVHSNLGSMVTIAEALLEKNFQVVLFDAPAHGEALGTTADPGEVRELIRGMYDRFPELHAVISHSLGGLWALSAWSHDVRAKAFVAISSPSTKLFLVEKFAELNAMEGETIQELVRQLESRLGEGGWAEYSPSEVVKTINVPGLIIHGETDDYVPPAHAEDLHSCWRRSTVEFVEDAGLFDIVESPEVRKIISTYLQEVE